MKNSNDYFAKRIANSYWDTFNQTNKNHKKLIKIYKKACDEVLKELYQLETDFSENGIISRSKIYKANQLKKISFEYKKVLKDLGEEVEKTGKLTILKAGKDIVDSTSEILKDINTIIKYNPYTAKKLYQKPWHGANFSERVWRNQGKLHKELNDILTKGIITGKPTAQMAMELNSRMNTGLHNASRLIRSETMHQMNEINKVSMKEAGINKVQEIVTLDERTSNECSPHNKKVHDIDKAPILPRHPNCRCVLVPYIDVDKVADEFDRREDEIILKSEINKYKNSKNAETIEDISKLFSKDKYYVGKFPIDINGFPNDKKVYITRYDMSRILFRHGNEITENAMNNLYGSVVNPENILKIEDKGDNRIMIINNVDDNNHFTEMILVEKNDNIIIHFLMKNNIRKEKILEKHKLLYSYKKKDII
ncbi:minor capsid protein [Helcococcus bovis]|uniref:minor capsid protein n=1 Tax=Helcococcus bovis TaxID=3153252 RepID=UPI0038BB0A7E